MSATMTGPAAMRGATAPARATHEVIIIGAGFAGLGMAHQVKASGEERFVVLEKGADVGGCWRDNTYPGCACDIPSHLYSFSFDRRWDWSRMYPRQAEIWGYLRSVADKFDLRRHIRFNAPLEEALWDEAAGLWHVRAGAERFAAPFLVMGLGPLNIVEAPKIAGLESFAGKSFHSAEWDHSHDLAGRRVGVIGTGASSIQFVPQIQKKVGKLTLFQRTPPWVVPRHDRAFTALEKRVLRSVPGALGALRAAIYGFHEVRAFGFIWPKLKLMQGMQLLAKHHMKRAVKDPALRKKLTPDYSLGCKRVLVSDDYYPAVAQPNVEVVTDRIARIVPEGVITTDGTLHAVDTLIFGTGFTVDNPVRNIRIEGRGGRLLADVWENRFEAFKGTAVHGFPNLFYLIGPNTGLGHNSMVFMIESQIRYVMDAMRRMQAAGARAIEVRAEVQDQYNREMQAKSAGTVWSSGCASWYLDREGRNAALWPGFSLGFRQALRHANLNDYDVVARGAANAAE